MGFIKIKTIKVKKSLPEKLCFIKKNDSLYGGYSK